MNAQFTARSTDLLIVGESGGTHIGGSLFNAAKQLGLSSSLVNSSSADKAPLLLQRLNYRLRGRHPLGLERFSRNLVEICRMNQPRWLLTTGIAPVSQAALEQVGHLGIQRINFLTDDPWNPVHRAFWFMQALLSYDVVFSPRRANIVDLIGLGCQRVEYLPFAFDSDLFYLDQPFSEDNTAPDVVFAGGADRDRVPYMAALINAGFDVALYGGFWERYPETRDHARGHADVSTLRKVIRQAKVAPCLTRQANRDGHCMRTFEVPALQGCMLAEDTPEHREILGVEGEAAVYFSTIPEMVEKTRWLIEHKDERQRLAENAYARIVKGQNTYIDRLKIMLKLE